MVPGVPSNSIVMKRDIAATSAGASVCSACNSGDRWIIHHRKAYLLVCTSCVLKLNITAFCPICFSLHRLPRESPAPPPEPTLVCFKCKSVSHANCVAANTLKSLYLCPTCINPSSKLFDFSKSNSSNQAIDLKSAKALLAAAMIAENSLNESVDQARVDAERKAKEAVFARKRAKDSLDRLAILWSREIERMKPRESNGGAAAVPASVFNLGAVSDDLQKDFERVTLGRNQVAEQTSSQVASCTASCFRIIIAMSVSNSCSLNLHSLIVEQSTGQNYQN